MIAGSGDHAQGYVDPPAPGQKRRSAEADPVDAVERHPARAFQHDDIARGQPDVSVRGRGGNSAPLGGGSGVAIEVYGQGGVCRLQPITEGTADDQVQHAALRAP